MCNEYFRRTVVSVAVGLVIFGVLTLVMNLTLFTRERYGRCFVRISCRIGELYDSGNCTTPACRLCSATVSDVITTTLFSSDVGYLSGHHNCSYYDLVGVWRE